MPQTAQRDYYEVLGVPRDADGKEIKKAFHRLALKYHPDRSEEPDAEERFKEAAEAYAVLSDPQKRAEYDARGRTAVSGLSPEDLWAGMDLGDIFADVGLRGFDTGGLFERLFGRPARPARPRGADIEVRLAVPLARVLSGGEQTVPVRRLARCGTCGGSGAKPGTEPRTCSMCGGTGKRVAARRDEGLLVRHITTCTACGGRGTVIDEPCPACGGRGEVEQHDTVTVEIPPGVEDGDVLRVPGLGMPGPGPGDPPGDVYVVVQTAPDPRFARRGPDLWHRAEIEVPDAVLGTLLTVPTLEDETTLRIPPGTQPNQVFRITGRGLPRPRGGGRGDMLVTVTVRIPDQLDEAERELYERLRDSRRKGGAHGVG